MTRWPVLLTLPLVGCTLGLEPDDAARVPPSPTVADGVEDLLAGLEYYDDGMTHDVPLDDPDGELHAAVERGLERTISGEGSLRFAFFGSSHVAGDLVTGYLRQRLQRHFGDAGHGFVTAVPLYGGYWQWGVRVEDGEGWETVEPTVKDMAPDAYGMTGIGFDAVEPAWAAIDTETTRASHLEVHFLRQPGGGPLELRVDGVPLTIETDFERRAAGIEYVALADRPHRVEISASGERPTRLYGFVLERETPGVVVDQLGVNGLTAAIALLSDEAVVRDFVAARRPDVVAIWLGANEASEGWPLEHQETNLRAIVTRIRDAAPTAACLVLGPLDRRQHDEAGNPFVPGALAGLFEVHRRVARDMGCAYFDSYAWQGDAGAVERYESADPPLVRDDRLHLTHRGYVRLGASLLRALLTPSPGR